MKRSKFTEDQIAFALKQNELGTSVEEGCREHAHAAAPASGQATRQPVPETLGSARRRAGVVRLPDRP